MTTQEMADLFEKQNKEYLQFANVIVRFCNRPDLHAMILLNEIADDDCSDIVCRAPDTYNEFAFRLDVDNIAANITEEQIIDLIRCGVMYDKQHNILTMFF